MSTLSDLLGDIAQMICDHEIEQALTRVNEAQGKLDRVSFHGRQNAIGEVNKAILQTKLHQQAIAKAILHLPPRYQLDVTHRLMFIVDELCREQLTDLLKTKRVLSKSAQPPGM